MLLHYLDDMDSKMECMRHLIETDRQVAGNFTSYCTPLERVLLKKEAYLAGPTPTPPSAPPQPIVAAAPKTNSAFGDKLLRALRPADDK